jgi:hypothetical protein
MFGGVAFARISWRLSLTSVSSLMLPVAPLGVLCAEVSGGCGWRRGG